MGKFDNILFISILQILPSSIFFILIWTSIDNIILKNILAMLIFSIWPVIPGICIRKSRYSGRVGILSQNSKINTNHRTTILVIKDENRLGISKLICILFPTLITTTTILISIFYFFELFELAFNTTIIIDDFEWLVITICTLFIVLLSTVTFYIGTGYMDWDRGQISCQYGLTLGGLYITLVFNLYIPYSLGIIFILSILPVIYESIKNNNPNDIENGNGKVSDNRNEINNETGLNTSRSIDNLIKYGSMEMEI